MRVWQISSLLTDSLELADRPQASARRGRRYWLKSTAVSLNYRDLMMVKGVYNPKMRPRHASPAPMAPAKW